MCFEKYIDDINYCVENFDIDVNNYKQYTPKELGIDADESNKIYLKDDILPQWFSIEFNRNAKDCQIFIGKNLIKKKLTKIALKKDKQFLYIGNDCKLADIRIFLSGIEDFLIIGDNIEVVQTNNKWITGVNSGTRVNGIIIGDDVLIGSDSVFRGTDGHPIVDLITNTQVNSTQLPIIIEPYCWLGQRSTILKNVRIGACSVVGFGAVVTKSCNKFSSLSGVPAIRKDIYGKLWKKGHNNEDKEKFTKYKKRFILDKVDK